jgi:hypothetical protein
MNYPLVIGRKGTVLTTLLIPNSVICREAAILGLRTNDIVNSWKNYRASSFFSGTID